MNYAECRPAEEEGADHLFADPHFRRRGFLFLEVVSILDSLSSNFTVVVSMSDTRNFPSSASLPLRRISVSENGNPYYCVLPK